MAENQRHVQSDTLRQTRSKLTETFHEQKVAGTPTKRKAVLLEQSKTAMNQHAVEKDVKKPGKMEIPVSLDIDPFTSDRYTDPQGAVDQMLSTKGTEQVGERGTPEKTVLPKSDSEQMLVRAKRAETEVLTLKHQLREARTELSATKEIVREKDAMIRDQEARIDELIESRVPMDDMDDVVAENRRLQQELEEKEELLADCQKVIEEYVAADEAP